jgi:hypothetical protein
MQLASMLELRAWQASGECCTRLVEVDVPALGVVVPAGAGRLHLDLLFRRLVEQEQPVAALRQPRVVREHRTTTSDGSPSNKKKPG